nr:MAG TPA: hypothetical protein [Bacteriophage sp.]
MGLSFHRIYLLHSRVLLFLVGLKNFLTIFVDRCILKNTVIEIKSTNFDTA